MKKQTCTNTDTKIYRARNEELNGAPPMGPYVFQKSIVIASDVSTNPICYLRGQNNKTNHNVNPDPNLENTYDFSYLFNRVREPALQRRI